MKRAETEESLGLIFFHIISEQAQVRQAQAMVKFRQYRVGENRGDFER